MADLGKSINVLDAINFSAEANKKVSENGIIKCFINCGFNFCQETEKDHSSDKNGQIEIQNMLRTLYDGNHRSAHDFIIIDDDTCIENDSFDYNTIIASVQSIDNLPEEMDEEVEVPENVTQQEAFISIENLKYLLHNLVIIKFLISN